MAAHANTKAEHMDVGKRSWPLTPGVALLVGDDRLRVFSVYNAEWSVKVRGVTVKSYVNEPKGLSPCPKASHQAGAVAFPPPLNPLPSLSSSLPPTLPLSLSLSKLESLSQRHITVGIMSEVVFHLAPHRSQPTQ